MKKNITTSEPALSTSTITALVGAALTLAVAFGLDLSKEQLIALGAFVAAVAPLVSGYFTRRQVTPSSEVAVMVTPSGAFVAADALPEVENGTVVDLPLAA